MGYVRSETRDDADESLDLVLARALDSDGDDATDEEVDADDATVPETTGEEDAGDSVATTEDDNTDSGGGDMGTGMGERGIVSIQDEEGGDVDEAVSCWPSGSFGKVMALGIR